MPPAVQEKLHTHYLMSARRNLLLTAELLRILDLFDKNGIQAIPFKGPMLAHTLYDDPALREFVDLDILVRKSDVFKALMLLPVLGYKQIPQYSAAAQAGILKWGFNYHLDKQNGKGFIELHWDMMPFYFSLPIAGDDWWRRAESVQLQSRRVLNLSIEDLLMVLAAHGSRHSWRSLTWITDMVLLLDKHRQINWDSILKQYGHNELQRMVFLTLLVAQNLANASVPAEILSRARADSTAAKLARKVEADLFNSGAGDERLRLKLFQFQLKSDWAGRIRFCWRALMTLGYRRRL